MNHRDVRKVSHVLPVALLVAGVLYRPCYCGTGISPIKENPRAQVSRVLLALPAMAFPATGRGTALVLWDTGADRPADQPRFVEFAFKGPMSRSDVFEFGTGKKGPWLYSHAITDRFHFGVNAAGARISYHPRHNQLGGDFHPAVFLSYPQEGEGPLDERLRRYLTSEAELAAEAGTGFSHVYSPSAAALSEWKETTEETEPAPNAEEPDAPPAQPVLYPTNEQAPSETAAPARVPLTGASSTPAPARVSGGTPGAPEDLSHETAMDANAGKQPGGSVPPAPLPAGKTHAAGTDPWSTSPHRVVRIHTLVGLLLLLGMAGVVAGARARTRTRDR